MAIEAGKLAKGFKKAQPSCKRDNVGASRRLPIRASETSKKVGGVILYEFRDLSILLGFSK